MLTKGATSAVLARFLSLPMFTNGFPATFLEAVAALVMWTVFVNCSLDWMWRWWSLHGRVRHHSKQISELERLHDYAQGSLGGS